MSLQVHGINACRVRDALLGLVQDTGSRDDHKYNAPKVIHINDVTLSTNNHLSRAVQDAQRRGLAATHRHKWVIQMVRDCVVESAALSATVFEHREHSERMSYESRPSKGKRPLALHPFGQDSAE